ncbi:hypothetical protein [Tolypothrix sp. VBCCA 56010]|uniref:hypothetical protein n=1 Tax=Tolypothrix sp. VBCCA 56010 TaxID=3137731 RepID=UPI003D7C614B
MGHRAWGIGHGASGRRKGERENISSFLSFTLYPLPFTPVQIPIAHCPMPIAQCPLPIAQCPMPSTYLYKVSMGNFFIIDKTLPN